jgi:Fe-S-cluster-containing dehydrogenase component
MTINGRTRRACTTRVKHGMVLEPLYDYPVIKDLVVDFGTKTEMPGGGYVAIRRGSVAIQSSFRQSRPLKGPWVHMSVETEHCLSCTEKPCVGACWVNRIQNLEDRNGLRLEPYSATIRIEGGKAVLTGLCFNCEDKPCAAKCPVQAFEKTSQGAATRINSKKCIGCGLCVSACRGGCIWLNLERGHAVKCDLCGGDPECVKACASGAIHFEIIKR